MDPIKNEHELLRAARDLDESALLTIYDHFAPQIYAHALQQCHDPVQADDVVARVFNQFLDELAKGNGPSQDLQTYFYQVADDYAQGRKAEKKEDRLSQILDRIFKKPKDR